MSVRMLWLPLVLLSLAGAARADAPPEGVDLEDIDGWEARAFDLTRGPPGCWALRGTLEVRVVLYQPATLLTRPSTQEQRYTGHIDGELEDGRWRVLRYAVSDQEGVPYPGALAFPPLVGVPGPDGMQNLHATPPAAPEPEPVPEEKEGRSRKERSFSISIGEDPEDDSAKGAAPEAEPMNLLWDSIHAWWGGTMISSYARWDGAAQGVELIIEVPTDDSAGAEMVTGTVFFPGGGQQPTRFDTVLPKRLTIGEGLVRARILDGQLHLRGRQVDGLLLPTEESASAVLGALGFTVGFEQHIRYTEARSCPGSSGGG